MPDEDAESDAHWTCARIRGRSQAPPGVPRMRAYLRTGPLAPGLAIALLLRRRLVDSDAQRGQLQPPNFTVDLPGHGLHAGAVSAAPAHELLHTQRLERERHI